VKACLTVICIHTKLTRPATSDQEPKGQVLCLKCLKQNRLFSWTYLRRICHSIRSEILFRMIFHLETILSPAFLTRRRLGRKDRVTSYLLPETSKKLQTCALGSRFITAWRRCYRSRSSSGHIASDIFNSCPLAAKTYESAPDYASSTTSLFLVHECIAFPHSGRLKCRS